MDIEEIERIGKKAVIEEAAEDAGSATGEASPVFELPDVSEQLADFLDLAAKVAGHGLNLPTIPQRFTHEANIGIASAAVKLCDKYGINAREFLLGEDSTITAWLGLVVAVGLPGYSVYKDIKQAKEQAAQKEVREAANDEEYRQQQSK